ncbi:uncharacterized protein LOC134077869 isoform X2 [Sardina pilchardus]|uniref:uncharacterized protein LOC134077869 isoform X2 n=1 Tax=Sardina pilchardus TaxID=27697 RepID=UPI002E0E09A3
MATLKCIISSILVFTSVSEVSAGDIFGLRGGSITLSTEQVTKGTKVTAIVWKYNKDKVGEWFEGDEEITLFSIFKHSATLDKQTWALSISKLEPHFNGIYSVEVNNKETHLRMKLIVLNPVMEPNITTDCNSTSCTLTCEGEASEHTQYSWKDSRGNRNSGHIWTVERRSGVYTCFLINPLSWDSRSISLTDELPVGKIAGVVGISIVGIAGIAVFVLIVLRIHRCRKNRTGNYTPRLAELQVAGSKYITIGTEDAEIKNPPTIEMGELGDSTNNGVMTTQVSPELPRQTNSGSDGVHEHDSKAEDGNAPHEVIEPDGGVSPYLTLEGPQT